jgi:hypothetical protein
MPPAAAPARTRRPPSKPGPKKISIAKLPVTGSELFGREEDIAWLDDAWANRNANVVTIVAWAGVGKSTLVNHWLRRMAADHYRSAELIFGWSFYRQGKGFCRSTVVDLVLLLLRCSGLPSEGGRYPQDTTPGPTSRGCDPPPGMPRKIRPKSDMIFIIFPP